MMQSPVVAACAILAIWVAGVPTARALGLRGTLCVATSWLFGAGALAVLMLLASALHVPLTRPVLAACWCVAGGAPCLGPRLCAIRADRTLKPRAFRPASAVHLRFQAHHGPRTLKPRALRPGSGSCPAKPWVLTRSSTCGHGPGSAPGELQPTASRAHDPLPGIHAGVSTAPSDMYAGVSTSSPEKHAAIPATRWPHSRWHDNARPACSHDAGEASEPPTRDGKRAAGASAWLSRLVDLAALAVCLFQIAFVLAQAVRVPLGSFDAWSLWEYKGRRFWLDGGITGGFLHDHAAIFAHPAYPPLVPLLIAWVYVWLGAADPTLMKPLFACFYAALLAAFFAALRPRLGARGALLATAALALLPQVADYAGTGLADVPLTAALVASAAMLARWWDDGDAACLPVASHDGALPIAGALLGVALLIKHDAAVFVVPSLLCVAVRGRAWRPLLAFALPAALAGAPWYAYVRLTAVPDRDFLPLTLANVVAHAWRTGGIARLFALNLLATNEWSVLWYAFGALLVVGLARQRLRAPALLLPVLLPLALYVCSLSLSAWPDYLLHARTSLDRLILVTAPFALWFVAEQVRPARGTAGGG